MVILEILITFLLLFNIPTTIFIVVSCFTSAEDCIFDVLLYPLLVRTLREKLSKLGTVIATILFSIIFAPAVILYYLALLIVGLAALLIFCFMLIFKRKD